MIYFLTASKDASVYLQQPNQNTGLDEILEISKLYYGQIKDVSRALIKFDVGFLSSSIVNNTIELDSATLILKETQSNEIPLDYTIYAFPISGSWEMGRGTRFVEISTAGVTWNYREGDDKLDWLENNLNVGTDSNPNDGTGGTWWTGWSATQPFSYQTADINMDVKSILTAWMSSSIPNDGFILKYPDIFENDNTADYGQLKFFSKETHTIYQPKIRIGWNDQSYITSSLTALTSEDIKISVSNLKNEYKAGNITKLRILGRELYPVKTFTNVFAYNDVKYLPQTSYYQIRDFSSNDVIIPFSEYSKISCDENGNYINLNLSNWEFDRKYKIEFKVEQNGSIQYFDDNITFDVAQY
jgi:hypothetical protein